MQQIRNQHPALIINPMVVQPSHPHHQQGHGPQHPTLVQQVLGTRVSAIPQDDLLTQDGGIPQRSTIPQTLLGVVMIQVGGNDIALPQSTVLSMQPTCMDAYLLVFAECIQLPHACREACQILEIMYFEFWIYLAMIPRVVWVTSACISLRGPGGHAHINWFNIVNFLSVKCLLAFLRMPRGLLVCFSQ